MMSVEAKVADDVPPPDAWPPGEEIFGSLEEGAEPVVPGAEPSGSGTDPVRLTAWVRGRVQGVGFRWWVRSRALELGLAGWAENLADGRVKVVAEGSKDGCAELLELLGSQDTPGQVDHVTHRWDNPRGGLVGFTER
jgi:acylphosphatase